MKESIPSRSRTRATLLGAGIIVLLAIGVAVLLTRNDDAPRRSLPGSDGNTESDGEATGTPAFRFTTATRKLIPTSPGRIKRRQRKASGRAAVAARTVLDTLYTEGFLDPENREQGRYADAFDGFASGAKKRAEARPGLLTAGARAGDRYEQILPLSSRIDTRILLGRRGSPTLLLSHVRFSALATGPETVTLRSSGQFFFECVRGSWKIVSFHVTRNDAPGEPA